MVLVTKQIVKGMEAGLPGVNVVAARVNERHLHCCLPTQGEEEPSPEEEG